MSISTIFGKKEQNVSHDAHLGRLGSWAIVKLEKFLCTQNITISLTLLTTDEIYKIKIGENRFVSRDIASRFSLAVCIRLTAVSPWQQTVKKARFYGCVTIV